MFCVSSSWVTDGSKHMSMQDVRGDWRAAAEWQIATEIYPLSPKDRKDQGMKAYLRTVKARVSGNTRDVTQAANDVTLDVSDDSFLDEGEAIEGDRKSTRLNSSHRC